MNLESLKKRNNELAVLNEIAAFLNSEVNLTKALTSSLEKVVRLFGLETGWIWLINPQTKMAYLAASQALPPAFQQNPNWMNGSCYCIEKYLENPTKAINISEITCSRLQEVKEGTLDLVYHASIPLFTKDEKLGILNVLSKGKQKLSSNELQLLNTVGDMLSVAIQRARWFEESRHQGMVEERNRLAREIHDSLAQGLSAIALRLETLDILVDQKQDTPKIQAQIDTLKALTQQYIEETRRSVLDLGPQVLLGHNLIEAIEKRLNEIELEYRIKTKFQVFGQYQKLDSRLEHGVLRIIQEGFQNVLKHAQAKHIDIQMKFEKEALQIVINDDGKGFDPLQTSTKGFGLTSMNERVKLLNGTFELKSEKDIGTILEIKIPIKST